MAEIDVKLYEYVQKNTHYVLHLGKENVLEYLKLKKIDLPVEDLMVFVRTSSGDIEINERNLIVTCYEYEQSSSEQNS